MIKRLIYLIILIIILIIIPTFAVSNLRDKSISSLSPITAFFVRQNIDFVNFFNNIKQISNLRQQNQQLEEKIAYLEQELANNDNIVQENTDLKKQLGVQDIPHPSKKIFAHVILENNDPLDHTITVDVGITNKVFPGQAAVYQGYLLGRVISTSNSTAIIRLITSKDSRIQAWLANTHQKGLLSGTGDGVTINNITQGINITPGSIVETSGLGGSLPAGILIGEIGTIQSKKSDLSQSFLVQLNLDPSSIDSLFIVQTNNF